MTDTLTPDEQKIIQRYREVKQGHRNHRKPCGLRVHLTGDVLQIFTEVPAGTEKVGYTNGDRRNGN